MLFYKNFKKINIFYFCFVFFLFPWLCIFSVQGVSYTLIINLIFFVSRNITFCETTGIIFENFKKEENPMKFLTNLKNKKAEVIASSAALAAVTSQAFCIATSLNNILNLIWTLTKFAGIVMVAIGVVQLIRSVIALTGGDQLQPGQLGKAIGLIAAGLAAVILQDVLDGIGVKTTV